MKALVAEADKRMSIIFPKDIVTMINYTGLSLGITTFTGTVLFILKKYMNEQGYEVKK